MYSPGRKVKIIICTTALLLCRCAELFGAPHNGDLYKVKQPDGAYVEVRVWGDEFYQRAESLDGYTLVRDPETRWICYAELNDDASELLSTGIIYEGTAIDETGGLKADAPVLEVSKHLKLKTDAVRRKVAQTRELLLGRETASTLGAQSAVVLESLTGDVNGLTLLIDFPDEPATISREQIQDYANQIGYTGYGNNGSVRDYFADVSGGLVDYTNYVTEYYTAIHNKDYYTDESVGWGDRASELIHEALAWLDSQGFDFSTLSTDGSGRIRAINAFYAGSRDNTWGEGLWPHMSYLWPTFSADGVSSRYYQITNIGAQLQLRTFCHENGHMIFRWPDLYDYGHDSRGIGNYGLMGYGASNYNPVPPNPSLRSASGWETILDITDIPPGSMLSHTANSLTTYRYSHPNSPDEYFLIESRIRAGRNAYIPDEGLLIWHVDESVEDNDDQQMTPSQHYRVSVEQADGVFHLENDQSYGGSGDLFHAGYADKFHDYTTPDAKWWSGENSGLAIYNISSVGATMTFTTNPIIVCYVDDNAAGDPSHGDPDGSDPDEDGSLSHPFDSIQEAIDDSNDGAIILVLDGTYTGAGNHDIDTNGLAITIKSKNGPEDCVIDCLGAGRAFIFQSGEDANTVIDGFTITDGNPGAEQNGGAIRCNQGAPKITNCIIAANYADWSGGAISLEDGSDALISYCTIIDNECRGSGGAICSLSSSPTIRNCVIADNRGKWSGALTSAYSGTLTIANSTIADNNATGGAGGLECYYCTGLTLSNSIVWNNIGGEQITVENGTVTVDYSDIQMPDSNTWPGTGNMNDDPLFADPNDDDYHLKSVVGRWNPADDNGCDFNKDGAIDYLDLRVLVELWLDTGFDMSADLDDSGFVDFQDFAILARDWGATGLETEGWVIIDPVSSPCIDRGDPSSEYSKEPAPNGGRVNMGAYGNTTEASKSSF